MVLQVEKAGEREGGSVTTDHVENLEPKGDVSACQEESSSLKVVERKCHAKLLTWFQ